TEELIQQTWKELIASCVRTHAEFTMDGNALPGAAHILSTVAEQSDMMQSLVTGNLYDIARLKLSAFNLHHHLDFDIGVYGSLSVYRHDLIATAVRYAEAKHNKNFAYSNVVILGDTPDDIAGAHYHGAVGIGVATGKHTVAELDNCGADAVLP